MFVATGAALGWTGCAIVDAGAFVGALFGNLVIGSTLGCVGGAIALVGTFVGALIGTFIGGGIFAGFTVFTVIRVGCCVGILATATGGRVGYFVGELIGNLVEAWDGGLPGVNTHTLFAVLQVSVVVKSRSLHSMSLWQFIAGKNAATRARTLLTCFALSRLVSPIGFPLYV